MSIEIAFCRKLLQKFCSSNVKSPEENDDNSCLFDAIVTDNDYSYCRERNSLEGWFLATSDKLRSSMEIIYACLNYECFIHSEI